MKRGIQVVSQEFQRWWCCLLIPAHLEKKRGGGGGPGGGTEHTVSTARHNFTAHKSQSMDMMGPCNIKQTRHMQYNAWTHHT